MAGCWLLTSWPMVGYKGCFVLVNGGYMVGNGRYWSVMARN